MPAREEFYRLVRIYGDRMRELGWQQATVQEAQRDADGAYAALLEYVHRGMRDLTPAPADEEGQP